MIMRNSSSGAVKERISNVAVYHADWLAAKVGAVVIPNEILCCGLAPNEIENVWVFLGRNAQRVLRIE